MSRVAVCTDSSALISTAAAASLGVEVVPISVALDGEEIDADELSLDTFYDRQREGARATTAHPGPAVFAAAYERAASSGATAVVSVHLDARASGMIASAELAARCAPVPVTIVDTETASYGVGICVRAAAESAAAGEAAADVAGAAIRISRELDNAFVVRSKAGGRVPGGGEWSVLRFEGGGSTLLGVADSIEDAVEAMAGKVTQLGTERTICVAVGHAAREVESAADRLALEVLAAAGVQVVERYRVGSAIGAHTGPDCFGIFVWPTTRATT